MQCQLKSETSCFLFTLPIAFLQSFIDSIQVGLRSEQRRCGAPRNGVDDEQFARLLLFGHARLGKLAQRFQRQLRPILAKQSGFRMLFQRVKSAKTKPEEYTNDREQNDELVSPV